MLAFVGALRGSPALSQSPGLLRVGTSGDYAPFSTRAADGSFTGFDVAVARRLAADFGRSLEFVPLRWPDLVQQLDTGAFDVAMSGVTVRADRAVFMRYTRPYAVTGAVAVIRAGDRTKFSRLSDCNRAAVRLGVNAGGHLEKVARERFPLARIVPVADNRRLPELLGRGELDAAVSEEFEARSWPGQQWVLLGPFTRDRKAYALPPSAGGLAQHIDAWLAAREADGWLNEQRRQWLSGGSVSTQQATLEALVAAIDLRLQLMPWVAAVKRRDGLPIEDPAQEARVLEHVRAAAAAVRLDPEPVAEFFRLQIEAAKRVESATDVTAPSGLNLVRLRAAVAAVSDRLLAELARAEPWLRQPGNDERVAAAIRTGLTAPGLDDDWKKRLCAGVLRVSRVPTAGQVSP